MADPSQNRGFHVLDDFVCEAIHAPSIPLANPANQGRTEEMVVLEEVVFDASMNGKPGDETNGTSQRKQLEEEATGKADLKDGADGTSESGVQK